MKMSSECLLVKDLITVCGWEFLEKENISSLADFRIKFYNHFKETYQFKYLNEQATTTGITNVYIILSVLPWIKQMWEETDVTQVANNNHFLVQRTKTSSSIHEQSCNELSDKEKSEANALLAFEFERYENDYNNEHKLDDWMKSCIWNI